MSATLPGVPRIRQPGRPQPQRAAHLGLRARLGAAELRCRPTGICSSPVTGSSRRFSIWRWTQPARPAASPCTACYIYAADAIRTGFKAHPRRKLRKLVEEAEEEGDELMAIWAHNTRVLLARPHSSTTTTGAKAAWSATRGCSSTGGRWRCPPSPTPSPAASAVSTAPRAPGRAWPYDYLSILSTPSAMSWPCRRRRLAAA